ncbi:unnamed protein product [Protopolystoma xenopodis]|uniref:Uncharacterized protein n=1 Tax=Protopolystoma xenopodis TaxID=117903 RepID=A0A448X1V1_9PLAT|nr:unnamed protein product [Protopolystoma xenopodis]
MAFEDAYNLGRDEFLQATVPLTSSSTRSLDLPSRHGESLKRTSTKAPYQVINRTGINLIVFIDPSQLQSISCEKSTTDEVKIGQTTESAAIRPSTSSELLSSKTSSRGRQRRNSGKLSFPETATQAMAPASTTSKLATGRHAIRLIDGAELLLSDAKPSKVDNQKN